MPVSRVILLLLLSTAVLAAPPPAPGPAPMSAEECAVWARELSFAQSVEHHDAMAFAEHVHPGAVFLGGAPLRGREAVVKGWAEIVAGSGTRLHWHPREVAIGGDPRLAVSRGPYWVEDPSPQAKHRYLLGTFTSFWVKGDDGVWRVMFDAGSGVRPAADKAEVDRVMASAPDTCPRA
ncbi:ketosteroid isomerase-like protein [Mizugakiibacter sediminis]|uniref:Ketosteroid isomerase n=1 Tax=Mizugakiibacter sediminis TaxID=1475481 RepID=A0A0K8QM45_9GAMM|nr:ketosteroid isomerase-like protein [Mizugakiibacter sediminis]